MDKARQIYVCPETKTPLSLQVTSERDGVVLEGGFSTATGRVYPVNDGLPDFTWPAELLPMDAATRDAYNELAESYEKYTPVLFNTYSTDEAHIRNQMTDKLNLTPASKVLEVGCGGGDGALFIAERLSDKGEYYLQELSPVFLCKAMQKLVGNFPVHMEFSIGNACYLPFPDNYFDAAHHFGGSNTFSDIAQFLSEMTRVVKPGGKVVFGDEGMATWLRETEFGKIMMNSNPLLKFQPPLKHLPTTAKDVSVDWIMKGAFFVVEFTVADKAPEGNYHIPIPSRRGGTHWSRYYGNLEGVTDEAKQRALDASEAAGMSVHDWLVKVILDNTKAE